MNTRPNQVRIIAGQWRGRKLAFPSTQGLRPTSDRIRETLFNWLAPLLPGSRCLDLFAGSGALGFEAASRGAERVVMVESHPEAVAKLLENRQHLAASGVEVIREAAEHYLAHARERFDIVFLDPPFAEPQLRDGAIQALLLSGCLKPGGYVYLEMARQDPLPALPDDWVMLKQKSAGQVVYRLYRAAMVDSNR